MEIQGEPLEVKVGKLLMEQGLKLALAESCTGGLASHLVTNVPGSSDYYLGGVTAYAYEAKEQLLGVKHDTLIKHGAVSQHTALEMARGIRNVLQADIGASITGIAGPGGGMPHKPVGLVWIALCTPTGERAYRFVFNGNRVENKTTSAHKMLALIVQYLQEGWHGKN